MVPSFVLDQKVDIRHTMSKPKKGSLERMESPALRAVFLAAVVLVVLTFAAYAPVRNHGPVSFDDPAYVTTNPAVLAGLTADSIRWAFLETHSNNWHPLTWISHMLDVELFGDQWGKHHLVSVGLHAAAGVGFLVFAWLATRALWPAVAVAAAFLLHPVHVESVAWLSERKDTLSALFFALLLLAWLWYASKPGTARYLLALALFACGLMTKPVLVTVPFVLLLIDLWPLDRMRSGKAPLWRRLVLEKVPFFALVVGSIAMTLRAQHAVVQSLDVFPLTDRLANAAVSIPRYLSVLLWPHDLAVFYRFEPPSLAMAIPAAVLVVVIAAAAWRVRHREPWWLVGWLWFVGMLVPMIGIVQVGLQGHADRYTYLPSVGLSLALFWGSWKWLSEGAVGLKQRALAPRVAVLALLFIVGVMSVLTWRQAQTWRDDLSLYTRAAEARGGSFWAFYNLGLTQKNHGQRQAAIESFEKALVFRPDDAEAMGNLAVLLAESGRQGEALPLFEEAARLRPGQLQAIHDLSGALLEAGEIERARQVIDEFFSRNPAKEDGELLYRLGTVLVELGELERAEVTLRRAVAARVGHAPSWNALGVVIMQQSPSPSRATEALMHFRKASQIDPSYAEAAANRAALERQLAASG